jgi:hypothetical protein
MKNHRKFPGSSLVTAALVAAVMFGGAVLATAQTDSATSGAQTPTRKKQRPASRSSRSRPYTPSRLGAQARAPIRGPPLWALTQTGISWEATLTRAMCFTASCGRHEPRFSVAWRRRLKQKGRERFCIRSQWATGGT